MARTYATTAHDNLEGCHPAVAESYRAEGRIQPYHAARAMQAAGLACDSDRGPSPYYAVNATTSSATVLVGFRDNRDRAVQLQALAVAAAAINGQGYRARVDEQDRVVRVQRRWTGR